MKIKKGDNVVVISGKDRAKAGKVVKALPDFRQILIEGVNMVARHTKARKSGQKGEKIQKPMPISVAKVKLICPQCQRATRVGYSINRESKVRICKQCGKTI